MSLRNQDPSPKATWDSTHGNSTKSSGRDLSLGTQEYLQEPRVQTESPGTQATSGLTFTPSRQKRNSSHWPRCCILWVSVLLSLLCDDPGLSHPSILECHLASLLTIRNGPLLCPPTTLHSRSIGCVSPWMCPCEEGLCPSHVGITLLLCAPTH